MPATIRYEHTFTYRITADNKRFPGFLVQLRNGGNSIDVDAVLDTGAEYSLFNGALANAIDLSLLAGKVRTYRTANRTDLSARVHPVSVWIPELGEFKMNMGFSLDDITRNILGRDFFSLLSIGFDEHHQTFHVSRRTG